MFESVRSSVRFQNSRHSPTLWDGSPSVYEPRADASPKSQEPRGVCEIDPLRDPRWAEFVQSHPRASVFHTPGWLRALQSTYGYEPAVWCSSPPGERLTAGLLFCRVKSRLTGHRIVGLPFSDHCEPLVNTTVELDAILLHLVRRMSGERWRYIEIRPVTQAPGVRSGFAECSTYLWHTVDLSQSSRALYGSFHKDCVQRRIRRAEREGLKYEVGNSEELLGQFYRLLILTRRRHRLPPQPYSWFRNLGRCLGDQLQVRLASHQGRPIVSIVTLKYGETVTYKYGCSDARFNCLGGMPFLLWRTIEEAKSEGMTQLDLGRANLDNPGLIRFKENWGARRTILDYLAYPARARFQGNGWSRSLLEKLVTVAPDWSLVMAGELLYPHIG